ncbi:MAG: RNA methyltransferase [Thermoanaerobaculia bacterium]
MRWIATCGRGLEEILQAELADLEIETRSGETGGVAFDGTFADGLRANWRLRTANRVLVELASWPAADNDQLYVGARALVENAPEAYLKRDGGATLPLAELFSPDRTFAIQATSSHSAIRDTRWIAMKVKDGIVDAQRERFNARSDIERSSPDVALRLRLFRDRATLLLDTSGEPLDRRGYRVTSTAAPLREQLAAAALLASGWNGHGPVVDLMCGSGTFLAEAGAIAMGLAPNRLRNLWAFERLPGFDRELWKRIREEPIPTPDPAVRMIGVDIANEARVASQRNLAAAGLLGQTDLIQQDAFAFDPPAGPGLVVANPPHGERMVDSPELWKALGDTLKQKYRGWKAVIFAGGDTQGKLLGLKPTRRIPVWNGPLEARVLVLDLW